MNRAEQIEQALEDCIASVEAHQYGTGTLKAIRKYAEAARKVKNLPNDIEPACYITIDALNALKTNRSSSVRVWAKVDEEQVDIPLYTHLHKADAEELIMRIDAESKWAGYGGSLHQLLTDLRTYIAGA